MAQKILIKSFENFRGLDLQKSFLTRESNYVTLGKNIDLLNGRALQGRRGFKMVSQQHYYDNELAALATEPSRPAWGAKTYHFQDSTTGENKQEFVGAGRSLNRVASGTFTVTGPANSTFSFLPKSDASGSWLADCQVSGVSVGGAFPYNCGNGRALTAAPTLQMLADAITALGGGWSASVSQTAKVNGTQVNINRNTPLTVDAGHTMTVSTSAPTPVELPFPGGTNYTWDLIAVAATSLTFDIDPVAGAQIKLIADNTIIGLGTLEATCLPLTASTSCSSALAIPFTYWEEVGGWATKLPTSPPNARRGVELRPTTVAKLPYLHNYVIRNNSNCIYMGARSSIGVDPNNNNLASGLFKYDGQNFYAAGMPQAAAPTLSVGAAGNVEAGIHKYLVVHKFRDKRGNYVFGNDSAMLSIASVVPGVKSQISVTYPNIRSDSSVGYPPYSFNASVVNGAGQTMAAAAGSATITVTAATNRLRVGDRASVFDVTTETIVECTVTSKTATTVVLSKPATAGVITLGNGDTISNGMVVQLYRTKANGETYYLCKEYTNDPASATTTRTDNLADASLGAEWLGPYVGRLRRDIPPVLPIIENHQGLLVGGGSLDERNTIYWSNEEGAEYFSRSTNSMDVSNTETGAITAIASADNDTLLVFGDSSVAQVVGDFYYGAFSLVDTLVGDVGCPSPHGWLKIRELLVFLSNKGPRLFSGGQVSADGRLASVFQNNFYVQDGTRSVAISAAEAAKLVLRRAVAVHDFDNQRAIFFIPAEGAGLVSAGSLTPNENSRCFVYDYSQEGQIWMEYDAQEYFNMAGGADIYLGELYQVSRFMIDSDTCTSFLLRRNNSFSAYDYHDNGEAIQNLLRPQWEHLGEPSIDKQFKQVKIWSLDPDLFIAFDLTIKSYLNFQNTVVDLSGTHSFATATDLDATIELPLSRAKAMQLEFEVSALYKRLHITGYELSVATAYPKERLDDDQR